MEQGKVMWAELHFIIHSKYLKLLSKTRPYCPSSLKGTVFFLFRPVNFLRGRHNRFTIAATFGATASTCLELFLDREGHIFIVGGPPWVKGEYGTSVPEMINPEYLWLVKLCLVAEMLSEIWKILLDYKSERNVTRQPKYSMHFTVLRSKVVSRYICDKQNQSSWGNYNA